MLWQISSFPKCVYHAFLSHTCEDKEGLVRPVYEGLLRAGVVPFLDAEDYYYGRGSRASLRNGMLDCRHIVFFVTDAMLRSPRGWCVLELAFAEVIELSFDAPGGRLVNEFLPLFFLDQTDATLPRTVWQHARDRGRFFDPTVDGDQVGWSIRQIHEFLAREQSLASTTAKTSREDKGFSAALRRTPGLFDRVTKFQPTRIPPA